MHVWWEQAPVKDLHQLRYSLENGITEAQERCFLGERGASLHSHLSSALQAATQFAITLQASRYVIPALTFFHTVALCTFTNFKCHSVKVLRYNLKACHQLLSNIKIPHHPSSKSLTTILPAVTGETMFPCKLHIVSSQRLHSFTALLKQGAMRDFEQNG
jgi:hypothetical protein